MHLSPFERDCHQSLSMVMETGLVYKKLDQIQKQNAYHPVVFPQEILKFILVNPALPG